MFIAKQGRSMGILNLPVLICNFFTFFYKLMTSIVIYMLSIFPDSQEWPEQEAEAPRQEGCQLTAPLVCWGGICSKVQDLNVGQKYNFFELRETCCTGNRSKETCKITSSVITTSLLVYILIFVLPMFLQSVKHHHWPGRRGQWSCWEAGQCSRGLVARHLCATFGVHGQSPQVSHEFVYNAYGFCGHGL